MPATRERTSASREPAVCAGYSNSTATVFGFTSSTATTAGGMPPWPSCGPLGPHAAAATAQRRRAAARGRRGREVGKGVLFWTLHAQKNQPQFIIQAWKSLKHETPTVARLTNEVDIEI